MHTLGGRDEVAQGCGHREGRLNQARILFDADRDFRLVGSLVALLGLAASRDPVSRRWYGWNGAL